MPCVCCLLNMSTWLFFGSGKKTSCLQAHFLALHSKLMYSACYMCDMCRLCWTGPCLCERWWIGPVWTDIPCSPARQREQCDLFWLPKRVCNTICSLNGARQRVRGLSHITTATILQQQQWVCSIAQFPVAANFVQIMNDFLIPCDLTLSHFQ